MELHILLGTAVLLPLIAFFVNLLLGHSLRRRWQSKLAASISLAAIAGAALLSFVSLFVWLGDSNSNGESNLTALSELKQANKEHLEHLEHPAGHESEVRSDDNDAENHHPVGDDDGHAKGHDEGEEEGEEEHGDEASIRHAELLRQWRMSHPMTLWNMVANQTRQRMLIVNITKPLGSRLNPATTIHLVRLVI